MSRGDELEFMAGGACRQIGVPDLWYTEKGGSTLPAKRVCYSCDVRPECLDYALENQEAHGVWGGKSPDERKAILRSKRRAQLSKNDGAGVRTPRNKTTSDQKAG
jgi:WhiB family redox-sensing transcriptional regulator